MTDNCRTVKVDIKKTDKPQLQFRGMCLVMKSSRRCKHSGLSAVAILRSVKGAQIRTRLNETLQVRFQFCEYRVFICVKSTVVVAQP